MCWVGVGGGAGGKSYLHSLLLAMDKQQCVCVGWGGGGGKSYLHSLLLAMDNQQCVCVGWGGGGLGGGVTYTACC